MDKHRSCIHYASVMIQYGGYSKLHCGGLRGYISINTEHLSKMLTQLVSEIPS